jgi:phosphatidylethanolamine/phosphatidyl-N-methylethanolamine N-methyltransferase
MPLKTLVSWAVFGGELIANPGPVGAAVPSSRALARRIASCLPRRPQGYVVELVAGTGAVTSALLERGVPPNRLVSVERSEAMVRLLKRHFPTLTILAGDAAHLGSLLSEHFKKDKAHVSYVVSSLPLRSLPASAVADITREVKHVLRDGGRLIQYTYDLRSETHRALSDFKRVGTSLVWMNIPPARVDVFEVPSQTC